MDYVKGSYVEAHSDEWILARLGHFTSSEWNKLFQGGRSKSEYFGKGALTYIDEKVAEIMTGQAKELIRGLPAIDWGVANEADAADLYALVTNQKIIHSGFYEYSLVFGGTPDRECKHNPKLIQEIKCPYVSSNFTAVCKINSGEEYRDYDKEKFAQCQGNMLVTCSEMCDMVYFDPRVKQPELSIKIIRIYRDNDFIKEGLERLDEATTIMTDNIENMLKMHERNLTYRIAS